METTRERGNFPEAWRSDLAILFLCCYKIKQVVKKLEGAALRSSLHEGDRGQMARIPAVPLAWVLFFGWSFNTCVRSRYPKRTSGGGSDMEAVPDESASTAINLRVRVVPGQFRNVSLHMECGQATRSVTDPANRKRIVRCTTSAKTSFMQYS